MSHTHLPFDIVCLAESEPPHQHFTLRTLFWESEKIGGRELRGGSGGRGKREEERKGDKEKRKEREEESNLAFLQFTLSRLNSCLTHKITYPLYFS